MKRKRPETEKPLPDSEKIETQNVNKTSRILNLKSVCTISDPNEVNSAFCLQSANEYILLRSKTENGIMKFERSLGTHQNKFQLSSYKIKCSNYEAVESLKVDKKRLYNSSNNREKNDIMLRQDILPDCVFKSYQVVKSQLSPSSAEDSVTPVLASLSSHGSLELSSPTYDRDRNDLAAETIAELSEIRKESFSLTSTYVKFKKLQEILNELPFRNFDWCPEIIDSTRFLAAVTKTNEIVICSLNSENQIAVQKHEKFEETISELKWVVLNQNHLLFVANAQGDLTRYSIDLIEDGTVNKLEKLDEAKGKLKIAVTNMQAEIAHDNILVLCAKAHSLEIFLFDKSNVVSIVKYIGMNITGLVSISNLKPEYLVTTLNNKIFYVNLSIANGNLKILQHVKVDNSVNPDIQASNYGAYGIAASKNKALIFIALYPRIMFDHLELKQPLCVSVNLHPFNDPYQMLLENESLKLTDYYDCVEAVRFIGSKKVDTLSPLESMNYRISMSEEFLYYLKIQLLSVRAKVVYYQSRSDTNFSVFLETEKDIKILIEVMNVNFLLKFIISKKKKLSEQAQLSIRCMCNFIRNCLTCIHKEPYKTAQEILKPELEVLLAKCQPLTNVAPEICSYCEGTIDKEKLSCEDDHQLDRCIITKLQIPITLNNVCMNCNCCVTDPEALKIITGKTSPFLCLYCDGQFAFR